MTAETYVVEVKLRDGLWVRQGGITKGEIETAQAELDRFAESGCNTITLKDPEGKERTTIRASEIVLIRTSPKRFGPA